MMQNELSPAKRALLEKWLNGRPTNQAPSGISRRPADAPVQLSFPQQRQLFLELLDRGTAVNNLSVFIELQGRLDLSALEKSTQQILARHEGLRTRFSFGLGLPSPEILPGIPFHIPIIDLHHLKAEAGAAEARRLAEQDVLQAFDLSKAPLIRLQLYQLGESLHLLLVVAHHTVADGWSLGVFLQELMRFYRSNALGQPVEVPDLSIQYADYAHWQTHESRQPLLQSALAYWKTQLEGELPVLELPIDGKRGARQTFAGGTHRFVLSKTLTDALEQFGRQEDATLFMGLLSVFYLLLHRYSGQEDLLIGTPIANRNLPELEPLIGVFINTLVLRSSLSGDPDFRTLLQRVRKTSLEAYAHQDLPFEKLVEELKPKRDLSRPPLFQVVFNLQNAPLPKLEMAGLETRFLEIDRGVSQFDLTLMISKIEGQCLATVEYNSHLFQSSTIARMFHSYQLLLEDALNNPNIPVSRLQFVPPEDLRRLVFTRNQTTLQYPKDLCFPALFEAQAAQTPDAIAVRFGPRALRYQELNQNANALAKRLRDKGVGPETRVGILMSRSVEMLEALLAVLKTGGTYVPMHTSFPAARIQYILKDADIRVLLTNVDLEPLDTPAVTVIPWKESPAQSAGGAENLPSQSTPQQLAYVIYTSGSTGHPKGVMVTHGALLNFLWSMRKSPGMEPGDVLMAVTSISFDIAALELYLPLMTGATVVIASEAQLTNPALLGEAIHQASVNSMQATPATWQLLLDAGWNGEPGLKALCGGDVLTRKLANRLLDRVGCLWNMYGPTETTIWSSICPVEKGTAPISIGSPIGNTRFYILDQHLQPLPPGVVGELHIGGEGLARGYLNQPQLSAEKFIPDPFSAQTAARLYKTGDRARYLEDDSIELLGRMDDQVKISGHRMELGEISAVLMQHPSVQDAMVITRTERTGEKRLVAYFVCKQLPAPDALALRDFLSQKLPPYMLPATFILLESMPLTPNGKVDRKSLPAPEDVRPGSGFVAPRDEPEQILAAIWQNVLDLEQVSIHDNFFDLGGASIQSLQIVAKANMYGYRLSVEHVFEHQTIAELAAMIRGKGII